MTTYPAPCGFCADLPCPANPANHGRLTDPDTGRVTPLCDGCLAEIEGGGWANPAVAPPPPAGGLAELAELAELIGGGAP